MFFSSIHHIAIICSNYELSKHFYTKILKLKIINETYRTERKSYKLDLLVNEQVQIELFSFDNPPKRPSHPEACGLRHLAFRVNNLKQVLEYLQTHNIQYEPVRIDEHSGKSFTFFSDPDGLPLELYEA